MHDYFTHVLHSYSWGIMSIENDNSTQENSSDIAYIGANDGLQESIKATFRRVLVPRDYLCLNSFLFDRGGRDGGKREGGMDGGKEGGMEERRDGWRKVGREGGKEARGEPCLCSMQTQREKA